MNRKKHYVCMHQPFRFKGAMNWRLHASPAPNARRKRRYASRVNWHLHASQAPDARRKRRCKDNYGENAAGKWVRCSAFRRIDYDLENPDRLREFDTFDKAFEFDEARRLDGTGGRLAKPLPKPKDTVPKEQLALEKAMTHAVKKDGNKKRVALESDMSEEGLHERHERREDPLDEEWHEQKRKSGGEAFEAMQLTPARRLKGKQPLTPRSNEKLPIRLNRLAQQKKEMIEHGFAKKPQKKVKAKKVEKLKRLPEHEGQVNLDPAMLTCRVEAPITDSAAPGFSIEGAGSFNDFSYNFIDQNLLGKGAYSKVFTCYNVNSFERYALKVFPSRDALKHEMHFLDKFSRDISACDYNSILMSYLVMDGPRYFFVVLDIHEHDIWKLTHIRHLHLSEGLLVVVCIGNALGYLRSNLILHGDVKTSNILISPSRANVVLADFGNAVDLPAVTAGEMEAPRTLCTKYYRPPEIIGVNLAHVSRLLRPAIDVFAFGCSLWEVGVSASGADQVKDDTPASSDAARPVRWGKILFEDPRFIQEYAQLIGGGGDVQGPLFERFSACGRFAKMVLALTHPNPVERGKLDLKHPHLMRMFLPGSQRDLEELVLRAR